MNRKHLLAAAALALIGSAATAQTSQQEQDAALNAAPASTLTRAQVRDEYLRARAAGELPGSIEGAEAFAKVQPSTLTRAEVVADLQKYRAAHRYAATDLESTLAYTGEKGQTSRTREAVRAEAIAYTKANRSARIEAGY